MISAKVSFADLSLTVRQFLSFREKFAKTVLQKTVIMIRDNIRRRTGQGVDVEGNKFMPYSESYAEYRKRHNKITHKVNLKFEPSMIPSFVISGSDNERILSISGKGTDGMDNRLKGMFLQESHKKPRVFFAVSLSDLEKMDGIINEAITKAGIY